MPFGTVYSGLDTMAIDKYVKDNQSLWGDLGDKVPKYLLGATIGTHVGPGVVGVAFFEK